MTAEKIALLREGGQEQVTDSNWPLKCHTTAGFQATYQQPVSQRESTAINKTTTGSFQKKDKKCDHGAVETMNLFM